MSGADLGLDAYSTNTSPGDAYTLGNRYADNQGIPRSGDPGLNDTTAYPSMTGGGQSFMGTPLQVQTGDSDAQRARQALLDQEEADKRRAGQQTAINSAASQRPGAETNDLLNKILLLKAAGLYEAGPEYRIHDSLNGASVVENNFFGLHLMNRVALSNGAQIGICGNGNMVFDQGEMDTQTAEAAVQLHKMLVESGKADKGPVRLTGLGNNDKKLKLYVAFKAAGYEVSNFNVEKIFGKTMAGHIEEIIAERIRIKDQGVEESETNQAWLPENVAINLLESELFGKDKKIMLDAAVVAASNDKSSFISLDDKNSRYISKSDLENVYELAVENATEKFEKRVRVGDYSDEYLQEEKMKSLLKQAGLDSEEHFLQRRVSEVLDNIVTDTHDVIRQMKADENLSEILPDIIRNKYGIDVVELSDSAGKFGYLPIEPDGQLYVREADIKNMVTGDLSTEMAYRKNAIESDFSQEWSPERLRQDKLDGIISNLGTKEEFTDSLIEAVKNITLAGKVQRILLAPLSECDMKKVNRDLAALSDINTARIRVDREIDALTKKFQTVRNPTSWAELDMDSPYHNQADKEQMFQLVQLKCMLSLGQVVEKGVVNNINTGNYVEAFNMLNRGVNVDQEILGNIHQSIERLEKIVTNNRNALKAGDIEPETKLRFQEQERQLMAGQVFFDRLTADFEEASAKGQNYAINRYALAQCFEGTIAGGIEIGGNPMADMVRKDYDFVPDFASALDVHALRTEQNLNEQLITKFAGNIEDRIEILQHQKSQLSTQAAANGADEVRNIDVELEKTQQKKQELQQTVELLHDMRLGLIPFSSSQGGEKDAKFEAARMELAKLSHHHLQKGDDMQPTEFASDLRKLAENASKFLGVEFKALQHSTNNGERMAAPEQQQELLRQLGLAAKQRGGTKAGM
ncbi:MAG: hypothetical protein ACOYK8_05145 [Alphaproteobacteria bacterium]